MIERNNRRRSAALFLRADPELGVESTKRAAVEKLAELEQAGAIEEYETAVWGKEIRTEGPLKGTEYHASVLERIEEFEQWAERTGASFGSAFERRWIDSSITDEAYQVISLPSICLALYRGEKLEYVAPCHDSTGPCSITDHFERLRTDEGIAATDSDAAGEDDGSGTAESDTDSGDRARKASLT